MTANTPPDLEALEELLAKATPGPWDSRIEPQYYPECDDADFPATISGAGSHLAFLPERYNGSSQQVNDCDAALIVAAVNALPHLIAALRDAREALEPLFSSEADDASLNLQGALDDIQGRFDPNDGGVIARTVQRVIEQLETARATLRKLEKNDG